MPLLLLVVPTVVVLVAVVFLLAQWRATGTELDRLFASLPTSESIPAHPGLSMDEPWVHHRARPAAPLSR